MNKLPLIGITGKAGVGKDTAGAYLDMAHGFSRYAFAKPIKDMLGSLGLHEEFFSDREVKEAVIPAYGCSYRHLAQTLGTEWGRSIHPEFWLQLAKLRYATVNRSGESYGMVVTDVRFENEAQWIREEGGVVVHIHGRETTVEGAAAKHVSENGVSFHSDTDVLISNEGSLPELYRKLDAILRRETFNG
ncbi:deoxynucleotide monophosphate kinase family protein [Cupriavidus necator]